MLPVWVCSHDGIGKVALHGFSMWFARFPQPKSSQPTDPGLPGQRGMIARLSASSTASPGRSSYGTQFPSIVDIAAIEYCAAVSSQMSNVCGKVTGSAPQPALAGQTSTDSATTAVASATAVHVCIPKTPATNVSNVCSVVAFTPCAPVGIAAVEPHGPTGTQDATLVVGVLGASRGRRR